MAPELYKEMPYSIERDAWAVGVCVAFLLTEKRGHCGGDSNLNLTRGCLQDDGQASGLRAGDGEELFCWVVHAEPLPTDAAAEAF